MANPIMVILSSACSAEAPAKGAQSPENGEFLGVLNSNISSSNGDTAEGGEKGPKTKECKVEIDVAQGDSENTSLNTIFATCMPTWTLPDVEPVINVSVSPDVGAANFDDAAESAPADINAGDLLLPGRILMDGLGVSGAEVGQQPAVASETPAVAAAESAAVLSQAVDSGAVQAAITPEASASKSAGNQIDVAASVKPLSVELPKETAPVTPGRSIDAAGLPPERPSSTPALAEDVAENPVRANNARMPVEFPITPAPSAGQQLKEGGLGEPILKGDFIRNQESGSVPVSFGTNVVHSEAASNAKLVSAGQEVNAKTFPEFNAPATIRPEIPKPEQNPQVLGEQQTASAETAAKVVRAINSGAPEQFASAVREQPQAPATDKPAVPASNQAVASVEREPKGEAWSGETGQDGTSRQNSFSRSLFERGGEMFREPAITASANPMEQPGASADGMVLQRSAAAHSVAQSGAVLQKFESIQEFAGNIGRHAATLIRGDLKQMTVTLIPGDLGRVILSCRDTGNGVSVIMQAENPTACNLLQRQEADVRATLAQEGYNMTRFEVGTGNGGRNQERQDHLDWQRAEDENDAHWQSGGKSSASAESAPAAPTPVAVPGGRFWAIA